MRSRPIIPNEYPKIELEYDNGTRYGHQIIAVHPVIRGGQAHAEIVVTDVSAKKYSGGTQRTIIIPLVLSPKQLDTLYKRAKAVLREVEEDLAAD